MTTNRHRTYRRRNTLLARCAALFASRSWNYKREHVAMWGMSHLLFVVNDADEEANAILHQENRDFTHDKPRGYRLKRKQDAQPAEARAD